MEHDLEKIENADLPSAFAFHGSPAYCYGAYRLRLRFEDSWEGVRDTEDVFYAMDLVGSPVILGRVWRRKQGVVVDASTDRWRYGITADALRISPPEEFAEELGGRTQVFALLVSAAEGNSVTKEGTTELPAELQEFTSVFEYEDIANLPRPPGAEHAIPLLEGKQPPFRPLYNLSGTELGTLREYLDTAMANGWIRRSESPAGAPILFVPKKDGSLRLCVDYRGLNDVTIKNRHPLPLISETLDRLSGAKMYSKLDLKDAYHRIPIREGDEWKTAFRTRYGHFEYMVMPFGLTNAPATFQAYINQTLAGLMDTCCVVYLDDILIFSNSAEEHTQHLRAVLARLKKHALYANRKKCQFFATEVEFLGFIVSTEGVSMDPRRVATIAEWKAPASYHEVQVFLGFANFYRRFIKHYSKIAYGLTSMLKGSQNGKKSGSFELTEAAAKAFYALREAFTSAPILVHFDPEAPRRVETDASVFAIAAIFSQLVEVNGAKDWHPVAYWSRKMIDAEQRYETHDQELLAIVAAFAQWRHYLEGAPQPVQVLCDHNNLRGWRNVQQLTRRQARWAVKMEAFDWVIEHRPGKSNPADAPSRRPDYEVDAMDTGNLLPTLQQKLGAWEDDEQPLIRRLVATAVACLPSTREMRRGETCQGHSYGYRIARVQCTGGTEALSTVRGSKTSLPRVAVRTVTRHDGPYETVSENLVELIRVLQSTDESCLARKTDTTRSQPAPEDPWQWKGGLLYRGEALYVPQDSAVVAEVLRQHHDDPLAGHFGRDKTKELIERKYWWPSLAGDVAEYVSTCDICQRTKAKRHRPYGVMESLPQPRRPWQELTMDFITDLPPSKRRGQVFDAILVVVDRFTRMAKYIPTTKRCTSAELAELLLDVVVAQYGVPQGIVSDRGSVFTSAFWSEFCYAAKVKRRLSTAFHPQTDGQTERQNQTLEQFLRCYTTDKQENWAAWLPVAEFAYNNSAHQGLRRGNDPVKVMSPFYALYGYDPELCAEVRDEPLREGVPAAAERVERLIREREALAEHWHVAREAQAKGYNRTHQPRSYQVGDQVMLSAKNLKVREPSRKLSHRYIGPFQVLAAVGTQAYRLAMPSHYRIHNVFHVSLLEPYRQRDGVATPEARAPELVDGEEEWEVEAILDSALRKGRKYFLVKWTGWDNEYNQWIPEEDLEHAGALRAAYEAKAPRKRRPGRPRKNRPA